MRWLGLWLVLMVSVHCGGPATVTSDVDTRAVYDRTDLDFDRALLLRPDDAAESLPGFSLAPLLIVENGASDRPVPQVTVVKRENGWTYRWTDAVTGVAQGLHLTLGADGFPLAYEVLADSSGARLFFVDATLEEQAAAAFGAPLDGRRYAVERGLDVTPEVVVGGLFEPGSTPLGPFVYLWEATHDVNTVLCRCMAPRVFDIVDSVAYPLVEGEDTSGTPPLALDQVLRLASN